MANRQGSTSFGPNADVQFTIDLFGSHRDENFRNLYRETTQSFQKVFQLEEFDILFMPGGGTLGVEATIASSLSPVEVVGCEGVFKDRWTEMSALHNRTKTGLPTTLSCHLETSVSKFQELGTPMLDVVSSFPYFSIPNSCDVFVLAANKQLKALAGLAIVGVRKGKFTRYFQKSELSYLSLARYFESASHHEMPSTVGTYLFEVMNESLMSFDLVSHRQQIDEVCEQFVSLFGASMIIGDLKGPVLTIRREAIPENLAKTWSLYEKFSPVPSYQIFTYSTNLQTYRIFINAIESERNK
jgi:hypothetical protein